MSDLDFEDLIYQKKNVFITQVNKLVELKKMSYLDAVLFYCEEKNIPPEQVKGLMDKHIKEEVLKNAVDLNLVKREDNLPFLEDDE